MNYHRERFKKLTFRALAVRQKGYNYVLNFTNDMEATEANMEIKVTQLQMTMMKTNVVLGKGEHEAI